MTPEDSRVMDESSSSSSLDHYVVVDQLRTQSRVSDAASALAGAASEENEEHRVTMTGHKNRPLRHEVKQPSRHRTVTVDDTDDDKSTLRQIADVVPLAQQLSVEERLWSSYGDHHDDYNNWGYDKGVGECRRVRHWRKEERGRTTSSVDAIDLSARPVTSSAIRGIVKNDAESVPRHNNPAPDLPENIDDTVVESSTSWKTRSPLMDRSDHHNGGRACRSNSPIARLSYRIRSRRRRQIALLKEAVAQNTRAGAVNHSPAAVAQRQQDNQDDGGVQLRRGRRRSPQRQRREDTGPGRSTKEPTIRSKFEQHPVSEAMSRPGPKATRTDIATTSVPSRTKTGNSYIHSYENTQRTRNRSELEDSSNRSTGATVDPSTGASTLSNARKNATIEQVSSATQFSIDTDASPRSISTSDDTKVHKERFKRQSPPCWRHTSPRTSRNLTPSPKRTSMYQHKTQKASFGKYFPVSKSCPSSPAIVNSSAKGQKRVEFVDVSAHNDSSEASSKHDVPVKQPTRTISPLVVLPPPLLTADNEAPSIDRWINEAKVDALASSNSSSGYSSRQSDSESHDRPATIPLRTVSPKDRADRRLRHLSTNFEVPWQGHMSSKQDLGQMNVAKGMSEAGTSALDAKLLLDEHQRRESNTASKLSCGSLPPPVSDSTNKSLTVNAAFATTAKDENCLDAYSLKAASEELDPIEQPSGEDSHEVAASLITSRTQASTERKVSSAVSKGLAIIDEQIACGGTPTLEGCLSGKCAETMYLTRKLSTASEDSLNLLPWTLSIPEGKTPVGEMSLESACRIPKKIDAPPLTSGSVATHSTSSRIINCKGKLRSQSEKETEMHPAREAEKPTDNREPKHRYNRKQNPSAKSCKGHAKRSFREKSDSISLSILEQHMHARGVNDGKLDSRSVSSIGQGRSTLPPSGRSIASSSKSTASVPEAPLKRRSRRPISLSVSKAERDTQDTATQSGRPRSKDSASRRSRDNQSPSVSSIRSTKRVDDREQKDSRHSISPSRSRRSSSLQSGMRKEDMTAGIRPCASRSPSRRRGSSSRNRVHASDKVADAHKSPSRSSRREVRSSTEPKWRPLHPHHKSGKSAPVTVLTNPEKHSNPSYFSPQLSSRKATLTETQHQNLAKTPRQSTRPSLSASGLAISDTSRADEKKMTPESLLAFVQSCDDGGDKPLIPR